MYGFVLLFHLLGACVWTGGHLVLAICILPKALKTNGVDALRNFETHYERIGIPALIIQVVTGIWLACRLLPDWSLWSDVSNPVTRVVWIKLGLLAATALLGVDARVRIIPNLRPENLRTLAWHIVPVTVISILFVIAGVSFRTGWLY
jgi:putative copper export protein